MDYGKVEFITRQGRSIILTLVGEGDEEVLLREGITALRRRRVLRFIREAMAQGYRLSAGEISEILLVTKSTVCRDIKHLMSEGLLDTGQKGYYRPMEKELDEEAFEEN